MNEEQIARINELAKKKRTVGLTEEELAEQQELRAAYIMAIRNNVRQSLDQIRIVNPDGTYEDVKERHEEKMRKLAEQQKS